MKGNTLEELEHEIWDEPSFDSNLAKTCHQLRKKPLDQFTTEDLRIMIGQKIGLKHLMPIAINILETEPLAEGDYYPGDLLSNVVENYDWLLIHPDWMRRIRTVSQQAQDLLIDKYSEPFNKLAHFLTRSIDDHQQS